MHKSNAKCYGSGRARGVRIKRAQKFYGDLRTPDSHDEELCRIGFNFEFFMIALPFFEAACFHKLGFWQATLFKKCLTGSVCNPRFEIGYSIVAKGPRFSAIFDYCEHCSFHWPALVSPAGTSYIPGKLE
jgi:hypothetical protein